jgi:hypothetical protein
MLIMVITAVVAAVVFVVSQTLIMDPAAGRSADPGHSLLANSQFDLPGTVHAVGALFVRQDGRIGGHFCTASVVSSPHGDLVITAAHCVTGVNLSPVGSIVFAPGYANGTFPFGIWAVQRKFVTTQWATSDDPHDDVAFLQVQKFTTPTIGVSAVPGPQGATVQQVAGAERLGFGTKLPTPIRALGYPDSSNRPRNCATKAVAFYPRTLNQLQFYCPGFTNGTSGGPFISRFNPNSGVGTIIGVIGGYEQGGDSPSISYSAAFTSTVKALYLQAIRAG